jgi:hypothetical protein
MIPEPGLQNSIPYFFAALSKKSKTSWLEAIERYTNNEMMVLTRQQDWQLYLQI